MIVVVGAIEELNRQQASMEFVLNDSTGRMKARFFYPSDLKLDGVQNGTYVSAVGVLKIQPTVHFSLVALHPVQSADQISYHMIEVAHASLRSKGKMSSKVGGSPQQEAPSVVPRPLVSTSGVTPQAMQPVPASAPQLPPAVESRPLKERITDFLSQTTNAEGVALTDLNTQFSTAGVDAVKVAISELL